MAYDPPFAPTPAQHPPREMDKAFNQWAESISKELEKVSTRIETLSKGISEERLRVETASNHTENKVALIETQFDLKIKELLRRIEILEDNNKWTFRTSAASLIGALFAIASRYIKFG